jgi:hypothetical protein
MASCDVSAVTQKRCQLQTRPHLSVVLRPPKTLQATIAKICYQEVRSQAGGSSGKRAGSKAGVESRFGEKSAASIARGPSSGFALALTTTGLARPLSPGVSGLLEQADDLRPAVDRRVLEPRCSPAFFRQLSVGCPSRTWPRCHGKHPFVMGADRGVVCVVRICERQRACV